MVFQYRAEWAGTHVTGAGASVFHCRNSGIGSDGACAQDFADKVAAFFDDIKGEVPGGVTWTFPTEVIEMNTTTGVLEDVHVVTSPASIASTGTSGNHARVAGGRVDWHTTAIVNGRRLRGRTFIVPLKAAAYSTDGTLSGTTIGTLETAAAVYLDEGVFGNATPCVYSRTHGILADIVSTDVDDKATVLRSRRD